MNNKCRYILLLMVVASSLLSCQKQLEWGDAAIITVPPVVKPKAGTVWIYRYYTYRANDGGIATFKEIKHEAKEEQTINGEKWLKVVEAGPDTTVYLLQQKTGGLYLYANAQPYLFCKHPAVLNEVYSCFYKGALENFKVLGLQDTLITNIGNIPSNYYEGTKAGILTDWIWYNEKAWIVRQYVYRKFFVNSTIYRYSGMFLKEIIY